MGMHLAPVSRSFARYIQVLLGLAAQMPILNSATDQRLTAHIPWNMNKVHTHHVLVFHERPLHTVLSYLRFADLHSLHRSFRLLSIHTVSYLITRPHCLVTICSMRCSAGQAPNLAIKASLVEARCSINRPAVSSTSCERNRGLISHCLAKLSQ